MESEIDRSLAIVSSAPYVPLTSRAPLERHLTELLLGGMDWSMLKVQSWYASIYALAAMEEWTPFSVGARPPQRLVQQLRGARKLRG